MNYVFKIDRLLIRNLNTAENTNFFNVDLTGFLN